VPEEELNDEPALVNPEPSPTKDVAVITPAMIPPEVMVTPEPISALGALKTLVVALYVTSDVVADAVIVPDVILVRTTLCEPEAALNVEPVLLNPEPSPTKDVAVITPAMIPPEVMVTPEPITALVAVTTPALTIFLLSSIIFEPESLIAIFEEVRCGYLELFREFGD
jgi:hypothetical protein